MFPNYFPPVALVNVLFNGTVISNFKQNIFIIMCKYLFLDGPICSYGQLKAVFCGHFFSFSLNMYLAFLHRNGHALMSRETAYSIDYSNIAIVNVAHTEM